MKRLIKTSFIVLSTTFFLLNTTNIDLSSKSLENVITIEKAEAKGGRGGGGGGRSSHSSKSSYSSKSDVKADSKKSSSYSKQLNDKIKNRQLKDREVKKQQTLMYGENKLAKSSSSYTYKRTSNVNNSSSNFYPRYYGSHNRGRTCDDIRVEYPMGVNKYHEYYKKKLDKDNDGWACEPNQ